MEELAEAPQVHHRDRSGRRLGAVVILLQAQENRRIAVRGGEVAAALLVPEMKVERVLELPRPTEPAEIEIGLVEIEQAADEEGVIGGEAADGGRALAIAAEQFARGGIEEIGPQKSRRRAGRRSR